MPSRMPDSSSSRSGGISIVTGWPMASSDVKPKIPAEFRLSAPYLGGGPVVHRDPTLAVTGVDGGGECFDELAVALLALRQRRRRDRLALAITPAQPGDRRSNMIRTTAHTLFCEVLPIPVSFRVCPASGRPKVYRGTQRSGNVRFASQVLGRPWQIAKPLRHN